jgi:predicted  nucleic acid-binding Zn-ribbon protein
MEISINTEVDKLINYIAKQKRASIEEIAANIGIDPLKVSYWLQVLSEEGYVKIEYKFTKKYAIWLLDEIPQEDENIKVSEETVEKSAKQTILKEEQKPDKALETLKTKVGREEKINANAHLRKVKQSKKPEQSAKSLEKVEIAPVDTKKAVKQDKEVKDKEVIISEIEKLQKALHELVSQKEYLEKVKAQSILKDYEGKTNALIDKILETEKRFSSIREVIENSLEALRNADKKGTKTVIKEAREIIRQNANDIENLRKSINDYKLLLINELNELNNVAERQRQQIKSVSEEIKKVEQSIKDHEEMLSKLTVKFDEIAGLIVKTSDALSRLKEEKGELEKRIASIEKSLSKRNVIEESIGKRLNEIEKTEKKLKEISESYRKEVENIENTIRAYGEVLNESLNEATIKAFESYAEKMEQLEEEMNEKLMALEKEREEMDRKISETRGQIKELLSTLKEVKKRK